jgi:hypothetical protein
MHELSAMQPLVSRAQQLPFVLEDNDNRSHWLCVWELELQNCRVMAGVELLDIAAHPKFFYLI